MYDRNFNASPLPLSPGAILRHTGALCNLSDNTSHGNALLAISLPEAAPSCIHGHL